MEQRDRAAGWQHAKLSGHKNEDLVKVMLDTNPEYARFLLNRLGLPDESIKEVKVGGLHETNVPSVNGTRKTKSKTDLKLYMHSGREVNISIKKSLGGQVYFVRAGLFIDTFEKQFHKTIPEPVKRAINLFWAAADDALAIIEQHADRSNQKDYNLQIRHKSLNATTLESYSKDLHTALLSWFIENAYELAILSFSKGAARDQSEWADYVWYKNLIGEHEIDEVFLIEDICKAAQKAAKKETDYGASFGGTTIQLPFGFVQWHQ